MEKNLWTGFFELRANVGIHSMPKLASKTLRVLQTISCPTKPFLINIAPLKGI